MSKNTINAALRSMGFAKKIMSGHGFRTMARTIMDELLGERVDLIEHQLAHAVNDPNGRAYSRTAHLPARLTNPTVVDGDLQFQSRILGTQQKLAHELRVKADYQLDQVITSTEMRKCNAWIRGVAPSQRVAQSQLMSPALR